MDYIFMWLKGYGNLLLIFAITILTAVLINALLFTVLRFICKRKKSTLCGSFSNRCQSPVRLLLILLALHFFTALADIPENIAALITHLIALAIIAVVSWLFIKLTYVLDDFIMDRFDINQKNNLQARKIHTQLKVTQRIVIVIVVVLALATMLMTFDKVRQLGTTILASAGIIGIVVGMAAQRTIGTFIAGLQIAFTQPIRVDDVVIVENEWGRIEEITLTYVVVKIWDLRRLILPITYFIEKPFQNWTRTSAEIVGCVYLYLDYSIPVDQVRQRLNTILNQSECWDKKVCVLQVTNTTDRIVELRALMSATDASAAWNLRCETREKLIDFIRENFSHTLPKTRVELEKSSEE